MIKTARFITSSQDVKTCPANEIPEYAFIGRSNVGKSSLINMLTNQKKLAKTSSTPGKTKLINHFLIDESWYLVDLPGYGYAKVSKGEKEKFQSAIGDYILQRPNLVCLFVLVDIRHSPQKNDVDFITWLGQKHVPFALVFKKSDKLRKSEKEKNVVAYKNELMKQWESLPEVFISSAQTKEGKEEIVQYISDVNASL